MQKYLSSGTLSAESFSGILRGETWSLLYSHTTGMTHFTGLKLGEVLPFACSTRTVSEDIQSLEHPLPLHKLKQNLYTNSKQVYLEGDNKTLIIGINY
jgi:hypothetical protein